MRTTTQKNEVIDHGNGLLQHHNDDTHGWTTWTHENDEIYEWNMDTTLPGDATPSSVHCVKIDRSGHMREYGPEQYTWPDMAFWFESEQDAHNFFEAVRKAKYITVGDEEHRAPFPLSEEELASL